MSKDEVAATRVEEVVNADTKWSGMPWDHGCLGFDSTCQCPYIFDGGHAGGIAEVYIDNGISSIAEGGNDCPPRDVAIANMHLIASAPFLFHALRQIIDDMGEDGHACCEAAKQQGIDALRVALGLDYTEDVLRRYAAEERKAYGSLPPPLGG